MSKNQKTYTEELRQEAVRLLASSGKSVPISRLAPTSPRTLPKPSITGVNHSPTLFCQLCKPLAVWTKHWVSLAVVAEMI